MNQLFKSFQSNQQTTMKNVVPPPPANLNQLLTRFAQSALPFGMNPEQIVRQKIQNGEISQEQFNQYAQIADSWTGRNR